MELCAEVLTRHEEMDTNDEDHSDKDADNEQGNDDDSNEDNYRNTKHDSDSGNWDGDDDVVPILTGKGKQKAWSKEKKS